MATTIQGRHGWRPSAEEVEEARANNMNIEEGYLGGYIRSSPHEAPSGLDVEHGDPWTWTPSLWRWACDVLGVRSVLDVGCGEGHAAAFFKTLGCDVLGVDGSQQAARDSVIPDHHVIHDFVDGPYLPAGGFDLVWSCEFVEHVEEEYCQNFLATFACSRQYILMTHAVPGQPGWHHVNLQEEDYWIEKVEGIGFQFDRALTDRSKGVAETGHYEWRGLVFTRAD